jgi:hypothetical protein
MIVDITTGNNIHVLVSVSPLYLVGFTLFMSGVRVVRVWCFGGVRVVRARCFGGVRVVHARCFGGVRVVHAWCFGGVRVVRAQQPSCYSYSQDVFDTTLYVNI